MDCIYTALFCDQWPPKALYNIAQHSHPDGGVSHARREPARQEQLGLGAVLRDTSTLMLNLQ